MARNAQETQQLGDFLPGRPAALDMTPHYLLRQAKPADYDFAAGLYLETTKKLLVALGEWQEDRVIARFRRAFKPEQAQVIHSDGADIGWLQVSETPRELRLNQIHIIGCYRNRHIGTSLIEQLLARARSTQRPVALNVMRGNPAISLYRRLGFRAIGRDATKIRMRWAAKASLRGRG